MFDKEWFAEAKFPNKHWWMMQFARLFGKRHMSIDWSHGEDKANIVHCVIFRDRMYVLDVTEHPVDWSVPGGVANIRD